MLQVVDEQLSDTDGASAVLKLLSGPQQGAEIPLRQAEYVVGSGDENDIVLIDDTVAPLHVTITVRERDMHVEAGDQDIVLADQVLEPGESVDVALPAVLVIGTTGLAVGGANTKWSGLEIPARPEPEPVESDAPAPDETAGDTPAAASAAPEGVDPNGENAAVEEPAPERRKRKWRYLAAAVAGLLAFSAAYFQPFGREDLDRARQQAYSLWQSWIVRDAAAPAEPERPQRSALEAAREALADLNFKEVEVTESADGTVVVDGFVGTERQLETLRQILRSADVAGRIDVQSVESLLDSVRLALSGTVDVNSATHLDLEYSGGGVIEITGFLGPDLSPETLRRRLRADVPALSGVTFKLATLHDWQRELERLLSEVSIGKTIEVSMSEGVIVAEGTIYETQTDIWRQIASQFVEKSGGYPELRARIVAEPEPEPEPEIEPEPEPEPELEPKPEPELASEPEPRPEIAVHGVAVVPDKRSIVLLADGRVVFEGDKIANGFVIDVIDSNTVVLRKDDLEYTYTVGGSE